jgi:hypothetical protein
MNGPETNTQDEAGTAAEATVVMTPAARGPEVVSITAIPPLPTLPDLVQLDGDLQNEVLWRRFMARQAASQTLSLQRTEWYARSVRLYVLWWFWLSVAGAVVAAIWIVAAAGEAESSSSLYFP